MVATMNTEQKAKAYDEAIKKAKKDLQVCEQDCLVAKQIFRYFPELAESEDERIRKFLIDFIKVCRWSEKEDQGWPLREDCIAWLEKQGGKETTEWSEEDINMIDWLIRCCEDEHKELCNDKYGHQDIVSDLKSDCRTKWDWLESLKNRVAPQNTWKPSDEQMKQLGWIAEQNKDNMIGKELISLYQDLKKLMEE